ncbi:MAG: MASE3 domain-containing protein [Planctomycetota bacterium]|jgi:PAS domain S-box-containing protein
MGKMNYIREYFWSLLLGISVLFGLWAANLYSYLLFHSIAEVFSIVVACGIFLLAWNSRSLVKNSYILFIGIAYLFVAGLDMIHTLAYEGMGVFHGYEANLSTQLWLSSRYFESVSLFVAPFVIKRKLKAKPVFIAYTVVAILMLASIFYWRIFPVCFVEGVGLTVFKKVSEYIICFMLFASVVMLLRKHSEFEPGILQLLIASITVTIASELTFTLYIDVTGFFNLIGHYLKIISFYLIYKAIIETGFKKPLTLLLRGLEQSENRLRAAVESLPFDFFLIEKDGRYAMQNAICRRHWGDIVGKRPEDICPDKHTLELWQKNNRRAFAGEVVKEEVILKSHTDKGYYYNITSPIRAGDEIQSIIGMNIDITERKQVEKALKESEEKFRNLAEQSPNMIFINQKGRVVYVNEKCEEIMGYRKEDFYNPDFDFLKLVAPEYRKLMKDNFDRHVKGREVLPVEYALITKEGERIDAILTTKLIKYGSESSILGIVTDITERKKAEESLQRAHDELEMRVEERTAELAKSRETLRSLAGKLLTVQEEERRRLARELHDDLNQRLAIMAIDTGRLEEQLKSVPGSLAENIKDIKERVIKLSADVHDISRQLHPSIIEDLGLKQAIESECLNFTKRNGIVIKYEPKDVPLKVPWDISVCLFRIVQEGLRNIARHALVQEAQVSLLGGNGSITLIIEDSGVGFELVQAGRKSGLGFISMEERVRLIRGKFLVKSKLGKGTIIKVVIPLLGN